MEAAGSSETLHSVTSQKTIILLQLLDQQYECEEKEIKMRTLRTKYSNIGWFNGHLAMPPVHRMITECGAVGGTRTSSTNQVFWETP
jgi:hypothetical protein